MPNEMIEKVALAIFETKGYGSSLSFSRDLARSAIAAMREPTEQMKHCSEWVHWGYNCGQCGGLREGWYAMMDEALK